MSGRDEMPRLLIALRGRRSQVDAARIAGLTQAKVSRAERGRFPLSADEANDYAHALGATDEQRRRLVELAATAAASHLTGRVAMVRVAAAIQERIERLQYEAASISSWQPDMVPGPLQTDNYVGAMVAGHGGADPGAAWWSARDRQRVYLTEPGRSWRFVVSESGLRWVLGSVSIMAGQLDRLLEIETMPNVELRMVPLGAVMPFVPPAAFHILGETVSVATEVGTSFITDPQDVAHFHTQFDRLVVNSIAGRDLRSALGEIASDYRR